MRSTPGPVGSGRATRGERPPAGRIEEPGRRPHGGASGARPAGGEDRRASRPPAPEAGGPRGGDGDPGPSAGGTRAVFLSTDGELTASILSEPAHRAQPASRSTAEAGLPGVGVPQEASPLGSGTAASSLCPHVARRVFLGVSCLEELQAC